MRPVCHSLGHVFVILLSAKSNDITNFFFVKFIIAHIIMSPEYFEIKNKDLRPL